MRKLLPFLVFLFFLNAFGQNLHLKIEGASPSETKVIDSLSYAAKHQNFKSLSDELGKTSGRLSKIGYLENKQSAVLKTNDSTFTYRFSLGKKTSSLHIYIGKVKNMLPETLHESKKDTVKIAFEAGENFLTGIVSALEKKGYSMARVRLENIEKKQNHLTAELTVEPGKKRTVNDIVINGYDKFPAGFKKNLLRMYRNKTFNQESLEKIKKDFSQYSFVKQTKYPEILFLNDSTKIYVYLEKAKANLFEGFIGFSNDENGKVIFNGYLDLVLTNILNSGERLAIYWKSDGKDQKTFNLSLNLPYLFKSPFALKADLNIFKQDSIFQNTRTAIDLGYFLNYNNRFYLGYQSAESSDIQNTNSAQLNDYTNQFVTANYEYFDYANAGRSIFVFPDNTLLNLKVGTGKRSSKFEDSPQFFGSLNVNYSIYLNSRNSLNLESQNYYLQSSSYIINELHRFGGINSIRGFNENSLQGNIFTSLLTEYRYALSPAVYAHTIVDYGYFQDKTSAIDNNLLGFGFGFGLRTKNGLLNLVYANGSTNEQAIKLSNSIVHVSFKATF